MVKYNFEILDNEVTRELMLDLIGTTATYIGTRGNWIAQNLKGLIELNTLDGKLKFEREDIKFINEECVKNDDM